MDFDDRYPNFEPYRLHNDEAGTVLSMNMPVSTVDPHSGNHGHTAVLGESTTTKDCLAEPSRTRADGRDVRCSIVVPMLNESATVHDFGQRVAKVMNELDGPCEVILVDDGSTDGTYEMMLALRARDPRFKVVSLSRNFGKEIATTAGLDAANGDLVVIMDGDLQHPPELLHEFIRLWAQGYDVVYAFMSRRQGQSWLKKLTASVFYRMQRMLTPMKAPPGAGDFRLVDRKALDAFLTLRETHRFVRGMWDWIGFRQVGIPYVPEQRHAGKSKYTMAKLARLALDGIIGFSNIPLRLALGCGALLALASLAGGSFALVARLLDPRLAPTWLDLMLIGSTVLSIQLLLFGLLGEYVGRIYDEVKGRPIYFVRDRHGFRESGVVDRHARSSSWVK